MLSIVRSCYWWLVVLGGVSGCVGDAPSSDVGWTSDPRADNVVGPEIVALEPILLDERTDYYLGNPHTLVLDSLDGSFLVADFFEGQIFRFHPQGQVIQRYGRPGPGPGEFTRLGPVFILNDSVVVGVDTGRRLFTQFSRQGGEYLGSTRYEGIVGIAAAVVDGTAIVPILRIEDAKSVMVWDQVTDRSSHLVELPGPYRQSLAGAGVFTGIFGLGSAAAWADTILLGMGGTNELYLALRDGLVLDTLHPPRSLRRGVPDDAQERIDRVGDESITFNERMEMLSVLHGIYRMSGGSTALIHHDMSVKGKPPMVDFLSSIYVSVLSSDRTTACVDGPVHFSNEMRVVHTVAGDTLYLLDRALNENEDGIKTWIRRYRIDTSGCDWLPVG